MLIGSEVIDGMPPVFEEATSSAVSDENQARRMVDAVAANRPNFIKVYNRLTQPEYQAIIDEARRKGLPVEGHVPYAVSIVEASESGQKSIEHLYGILLASSSDEEQLRKQMVNAKEADWMAEIAQAKKLVQTYDEKKANAVFSLLAKNKTWQCPTLTVLRTAAYLNDPAFRNDIRVKYMPSWIEEYWDPQYNNRFTSRTDEDDANFKALFEKQMEIVRKMNQFGVRMIAGTDTGNPYCFPGFSLHDELALLVQAGLSPMQALQMATRNAAEFSGELDSLGTIETGKIADLVLLESDPLKNIDNTRSISAVIYGGEFFDHRQLLAMLNNAESQGAKPSIAEVLHDTIQTKGIAAAFQQYHQLKTSASHQYDFAESGLKALASQLLQNDSFNSGIAILKLIAENYPDSVDAFDHLAAGYQAGGNKKMAIFYYNMALKKNPNDLKAKEQLAQLRR